MKRTLRLLLVICMIQIQMTSFSQIYFTGNPQAKINEASNIAYKKGLELPVFIKLQAGKEVNFANWKLWTSKTLKLSEDMGFVLENSQVDQKGDVHYRYNQTYNGIPIFGSTYVVHTKNNKVYSYNGEIIPSLNISPTPGISEQAALSSALEKVNAVQYKWQIPGEESMIKKITGNADATYYPKGELFYVPENSDIKSQNFRLAYRFDIYAAKPLKREYVFVDAITGKILFSLNRIQTTDVPGTAVTKYSGTQTIITDSTAVGSYRLHETARGNGIETYNMATGTNYNTAVDFTDADNNWNNVNSAQDEIATDAHWGAEKTYDYYKTKFNRNSIDGNGFKLISYVHYDVGYDNAYWDGTEMTYGDGDGSTYTPFTALDICGHEITHGLDEKTANLTYQDESGALNEGYSDIFGTCIEWFSKPTTANWNLGEDIGTIIRSLSNPNAYSNPDTYLGTYWDTDPNNQDNGGVHTNSAVIGYWFYLASIGGSGTNDNGNAYNVTGISLDSAAAVAFRTLTVYLTPGSNYADARFYSIVSAIDLFGPCTPQAEAVANAWYAVGVGNPYDPTVIAGFTPSFTTFCSYPAEVTFTNSSTNSNVFVWDFGDGTSSTDMNPIHTYNSYGHFTVTLIATGGSCGKDTLIKASCISVDSLNPCTTIMPETGSAEVQTLCSGILFDSGGNENYQDSTNSSITIQPIGAATITLTFSTFGFENNYDYLKIYDGSNTSGALIGSYTGSTLPNGGTITSTHGAVTIVQTSDPAINDIGFICQWQCNYPTSAPVTDFKVNDTLSCTGDVQFSDLTTNGPVSWLWNFGDGDTTIVQSPQHLFLTDGSYTVRLITSNSFGSDTLIKDLYVRVDKPVDPTASSAWKCSPGSVTLIGTGNPLLHWFDAPTGGNLVFVGDTFVTPSLNSTTTFYVQDVVPAPSSYIGPNDNTIGSGNYSTGQSQRYLIFDCNAPVELVSVLVYSDSSFVRTVTLADASGTILQDTAVLIPAGQNRINLHFAVPAGTGFRLGVGAVNHLYRNTDGAVYPYTFQNVISITGTNNTFSNTAYYYFYDWKITGGKCASNRIPSVATIYLPAPVITPSGVVEICNGQSTTLTSELADSYIWWPGNETTQSITVNSAGSFVVQVTDSICATPSDTVIVEVVNDPPTAAFTDVTNSLAVTFTNTSTNGTSYSWNFGDGSSSQLSDPTHTYATAGTYTITLITENACGTDTFTISLPVEGIFENSDDSHIAIYPNPSDGILNIDVANLTTNSRIKYSIYDMIGNSVKSGYIDTTSKEAHAVINLSETSKSVYFIRIFNESMSKTSKIIIN
jgi:Zn-dependent metalloprotease